MTSHHGIEGLRQLRYSPGSQEPVHQHEQGQLILPLRGVAKIATAQHIWLLSPGRAIWLPSGTPHGLEAINDVVTHNIYFTPPFSRRYGARPQGLSATPLLHPLIAAGLENAISAERLTLIQNLLSDEFQRMQTCQLCHVTLPSDRRLRQVCDALCRELGHGETLAWWGKRSAPANAPWRGCFAKRPR